MDTDKVTQCEALSHAAFVAMSEGMVLHQLIYDEQGKPSDYLILYANPAFTNQTGLTLDAVVGKLASVAYGTGEAPFLDLYAKVAITQHPTQFEQYFAPMDKLFSIKVSSPGKDQFATIFEDITERRRTEEALEKSEARYRNFAEELPLGVVITQNGLIKYTNPSSVGLIGYSQAELLDKPFLPLVHEDDHPRLMELHQKRMRGEIVESPYVVTMVRKDGQIRDWQMHTSTIEWDGKTSGLGIFIDITEQLKAETDLRIAAVAFQSQDAMMITDANGVIMRVNQQFMNTTGYRSEEVVGKRPGILKSGRHDSEFYRAMWVSLNSTGSWQGEVWDRRKNGEVYPKWLSIAAVKNKEGHTTHYVGSHTDITERKALDDAIRRMAFYDQLTQLPNRRLLDDRLKTAVASCRRSGHYGALMFLDLDNFKPLNDTHGHDVGDLLLIEVARRLTGCVREVDTVARFGGDEFVVVISELDDENSDYIAQAKKVAEKIRTKLIDTYCLLHRAEGNREEVIEHRCTASIGMVLFAAEDSAENILKRADNAMYKAKAAGRNQIHIYQEAT